ncbi:hypothetical protein BY458DRAFT_515391 [Sporodiniella umbellata]|nr:hypothetical protein BY458DRAFT_515391 [Sporodiniella umbellata]
MNDSVSILVAVFLILVILRWMLGGNQSNPSNQRTSQRQTSRRPQHRVTSQMIEMVRAMFPDIPTAAIQADLQRTGSVEATVDNVLRDGGLPLPVSAVPPTNNTTANASTSSSRISPQHADLVQRYRINVDQVDQQEEPPKTWETSPDKRQEILKKRKEFMVLQARKRMMEQKKKKNEVPIVENNPLQPEVSPEKSFDDMSVDELNSLTAEKRREHMMQAFQQRSQ